MTQEDIAKGIVYSDNFDTLYQVPKTMYGSSEFEYAFKGSAGTLKRFSSAFYMCSLLKEIDLSCCSSLISINKFILTKANTFGQKIFILFTGFIMSLSNVNRSLQL